MKRYVKRLKIPLMITGVLCLLFSPVVLYFSVLDELDSIHSLAFESADMDASRTISGQEEKIIGSTSLFDQALKTTRIFFLQVCTVFFNSLPDPKPLVLRC